MFFFIVCSLFVSKKYELIERKFTSFCRSCWWNLRFSTSPKMMRLLDNDEWLYLSRHMASTTRSVWHWFFSRPCWDKLETQGASIGLDRHLTKIKRKGHKITRQPAEVSAQLVSLNSDKKLDDKLTFGEVPAEKINPGTAMKHDERVLCFYCDSDIYQMRSIIVVISSKLFTII